MKKVTRFLAALALLGLSMPALATGPTIHVGALRLYSNSSAQCVSGQTCLWANGNTLLWRKGDGTDLTLGSGGTLATTYAAGASQSDSTMTLDSTRLGLRILDAASPINGIMFNIANNAATTSYFFVSDNAGQLIKSAAASGSNNFTVDTVSTYTGGTIARFSTGGTQVYGFGPFGLTLAQPAATSGTPTLVSLTGAASTGLTTATEVPDIDFNIARTVTWATGALTTQRFFRLRSPTVAFAGASTLSNTATFWCDGAPKVGTNATLTRTGCVWIQTGADAAMGLVLQANSATQSGALIQGYDSNATPNSLASLVMSDSGSSMKWLMTSQLNGGYVFLEAMSNAGANDLKFQLNGGTLQLFGGNGTYQFLNGAASVTEAQIDATGVQAQRFSNSTSQNIAFSATPAVDCTAGNTIHFGPVTANITGPTMVSGRAGEQCTIIMVKDATAGTYTVTGSWGTNVRQGSGGSFTSGSGSIFNLTFKWDDRLSTPAWVLISSAAFN